MLTDWSVSDINILEITKGNHSNYGDYYDENHKQAVSIDFSHEHRGVRPHRHVYLSHNKNDPGVPPTAAETTMIKKIKKEFHLKLRKNEYTSLDQFTSQYIGEWNPSEGHWFGLDFIWNGNE